jgi:hypothetical protein
LSKLFGMKLLFWNVFLWLFCHFNESCTAGKNSYVFLI